MSESEAEIMGGENTGVSVAQENEGEANIDPLFLEEMAKAGVLFGRRKSKTHPRMQRYIFMTRNGIEILDIVQTFELLERAIAFLGDIVKTRGTILFVGTTSVAKEAVKTIADQFGYPRVVKRWLGGTLTNFKTIRDRMNYFLKLKTDRETGRLEKYTKKERLAFDKKIERLTDLMGGLEPLTALPQAIVIVGPGDHETARREARRLRIPIVAIASSDTDPDSVDYIIPANDRAKTSVEWVLHRMQEALAKAKQEMPASQPPAVPVK